MGISDDLVAVVVPAYNAEKTIEKTISCILSQSHRNLKVFVVDDCSTDRTLDIVRKMDGGRIAIYKTPTNSGPSAARNMALSVIPDAANFVAFCDADDVWIDSTHLQQCLTVMDNEKADMVYSTPTLVDSECNVLTPRGINFYDSFKPERLFVENFIYISGVVLRRKVVKEVGDFDSRVDSLEDWDYWRRVLLNRSKIVRIKTPTFLYLVSESGMARHGTKEKIELINKKTPLKLNLGCGHDYQKGYLNCDYYVPGADWKVSVDDLSSLPDNCVEEILASHVIEHFDFKKSWEVLKEWHRVLKPGGKLVIETPDFLASCKEFVEKPDMRIILYGHFFAFAWEPGNAHLFLYTEDQLYYQLTQSGFRNFRRVPPKSGYVNPKTVHLFLRVEVEK